MRIFYFLIREKNKYFRNSNKVKASDNKRQIDKLNNPLFPHDNYNSLQNPLLDERLKNIKKQSNIKEIFSSKGFIESSFSLNPHSPQKLKNKITNKPEELVMKEVVDACKEEKKYRRNSCHTFKGKTGFYVS